MKKIIRLPLVALGIVALAVLGAGCSAQSQQSYRLQKADRYFEAGQYDLAEAGYLEVFRKDRENARAIGRLGTLYMNEGRLQMAGPFLLAGCNLATNDLNLRLQLASFYLAAGQIREARAAAEFVLARNPQDAQAPLLLVATAETPRMLEETRQRLLALSQQNDGAGLQIALGSIALRAGDARSTEAAFSRALTLDPKSSAVWSALGFFHLMQSNRVQADAALKTAADLAPARAPEKLQYAAFKLQAGDTAAGRRLLEEMVRQAPDYLPAWMELAKMDAAEKEYDRCAVRLGKVLARDPDNFNALMVSAQLKLALGRTGEATGDFERLSKLYERAPAAHYQLALAYLRNHELDKALLSLNRTVSLSTNFYEARLLRDELQIKRGNPALAVDSLKQLLQQSPQAAPAQLLLADAYRLQGNWEGALGIYRALEASSPARFEIPLLMGATFLQQTNLGEARKAFARTLALAPDNVAAFEQLVALDVLEKNYGAALQRVQAQLDKNSLQPGPLLLQAQIFMAQGDARPAEAALLKVLGIQPDAQTAPLLLARLYRDAGQNQKALDQLGAVTAKNPQNDSALLFSAMIWNELGNYGAARDAYEKVLRLNPQSCPALNNLACLYSEQLVDLDRAYELAQRARDLNANDPSSLDTLGWILCKRGQPLSAVGLLQNSARQLAGEPEVQFHLGWSLYMTGQEVPARDAFQKALLPGSEFRGRDECRQCLAVLAVNPETAGADARASLEKRAVVQPADGIAWARLGAICQRAGAIDQAMTAYESALKANPKNVPALIALAQLFSSKNNPKKAVDLARAAYKLAPENPRVALALGRLAYDAGDYSLSLNLLQEAAHQASGDPEVLLDFARAAYAMGQVASAQTALRSALEINPAFLRAGEARRFLSLTDLADHPANAGPQAQAILKSEPDYVPALFLMATVQDQNKDAAAAMLSYAKVLARYPQFAPAQKRLAILCAENPGDNPQAYDYATKARAAYPDNPDVARALGIILYRKADYPRAERILKENIDNVSVDAQNWYYLGMTQYHLKKSLECKKSLQQALALNRLTADLNRETKRVLTELK